MGSKSQLWQSTRFGPAMTQIQVPSERATIHCVHPVAGFPLYDGFNTLGIRAEKSRYDLARMEPRAAD